MEGVDRYSAEAGQKLTTEHRRAQQTPVKKQEQARATSPTRAGVEEQTQARANQAIAKSKAKHSPKKETLQEVKQQQAEQAEARARFEAEDAPLLGNDQDSGEIELISAPSGQIPAADPSADGAELATARERSKTVSARFSQAVKNSPRSGKREPEASSTAKLDVIEALNASLESRWRPFSSELKGHGGNGKSLKVSACAVYDDGRRALLGSAAGKLSIWDLAADKCLHELAGHGNSRVTHCEVLTKPSLVFGDKMTWPKGWSGDERAKSSLIAAGRFQPVTSGALKDAGAEFYCWLYPDESVTPAADHAPPKDAAGRHCPLSPSGTWSPGHSHGYFVYLFDKDKKHHEKDCFFPVVASTRLVTVPDKEFPEVLFPMGLMPTQLRPDIDLRNNTYELRTWHELNVAASGPPPCGHISPKSKITLPGHVRTKLMIPREATHFVWAYQCHTMPDMKNVRDNGATHYFMKQGGFMYLKCAEDNSSAAVAVNAICIPQKADIEGLQRVQGMSFAEDGTIGLWDLSDEGQSAAAPGNVPRKSLNSDDFKRQHPKHLQTKLKFCTILEGRSKFLTAVDGGYYQGKLIMVDVNKLEAQRGSALWLAEKPEETEKGVDQCFTAVNHSDRSSSINDCKVFTHSRDGKLRALSCGNDKDIVMWKMGRAKDDYPLTKDPDCPCLRGHESSVVSCAVFGRGRGQQALSWSEDHTLRIWELYEGRCLKTFGEDTDGHEKAVRDCVLFDSNAQALSCSDDGTLRVWDLVAQGCSTHAGKPIVMQGYEQQSLVSCTVMGDGWRALSGSSTGTVQVWDLVTGVALMRLCCGDSTNKVYCRALDKGVRALTYSEDSTRVWNLDSRERRRSLHPFPVNAEKKQVLDGSLLSFANNRRVLAWGNVKHRDKDSDILDSASMMASNFRPIKECSESGEGGEGWKFDDVKSNAGRIICCAAYDSCGTRTGVIPCSQSVHVLACTGTAENGIVSVWISTGSDSFKLTREPQQLDDGIEVLLCDITDSKVFLLCKASDRYELRSCQQDQLVASPTIIGTFREHDGHAEARHLCCGQQCAAACFDGGQDNLILWNLDPGKQAKGEPLHGHRQSVTKFVVSADTSKILSCSEDKDLRLWNISTRSCLKLCKSDQTIAACMLFANDSRALSVGMGGKIQVWDLSGEQQSELEAQELIHLRSFAPLHDRHLFLGGVVVQTDLMVLLMYKDGSVDAIDMSRAASDVVCSWTLWQLANPKHTTSREWSKMLEAAAKKQPHVLMDRDMSPHSGGTTLVHKLAKRTDGAKLLKDIKQNRVQARFEGLHHSTKRDPYLQGILVRAGTANISLHEREAREDIFVHSPDAMLVKDRDAAEITALTIAVIHRREDTVQILLDEYIAFVKADPTITHLLPKVLIPENEVVHMFETFPDRAAMFLQQLPLLRVRLPPTWQRCEFPEGENDIQMLVQNHHHARPLDKQRSSELDGLSIWEGRIYDEWRRYIATVHNGMDPIDKKRSKISQEITKMETDSRDASPADKLDIDSTLFDTSRRRFREDRAWGSAARAGIVPLSPNEKKTTMAEEGLPELRLNYSRVLEAAVDYAHKTDSMDIFDGPVLRALIKQKWESGCEDMHTTMTIGYSVYILLFSGVTFWFSHGQGESPSTAVLLQAYVMLMLVLFYTILLLRREFLQFNTVGFSEYISDHWNKFDVVAEALAFVALILTGIGGLSRHSGAWRDYSMEESGSNGSAGTAADSSECSSCVSAEWVSAIQATAGLFGWLKVIYFMRGYDSTAFLVSMLGQIVRDMIPFVEVLVLVLIG